MRARALTPVRSLALSAPPQSSYTSSRPTPTRYASKSPRRPSRQSTSSRRSNASASKSTSQRSRTSSRTTSSSRRSVPPTLSLTPHLTTPRAPGTREEDVQVRAERPHRGGARQEAGRALRRQSREIRQPAPAGTSARARARIVIHADDRPRKCIVYIPPVAAYAASPRSVVTSVTHLSLPLSSFESNRNASRTYVRRSRP